MRNKTIAYILAKLSHIFPSVFYCTVFRIDESKPHGMDNIGKIVWSPNFVDWFVKRLGG